MTSASARRILAVVAVALLLVTAGCLGGVGFGGDDTDDDATENETDERPDADELLEKSVQAESSVETLHGVQTTTWEDGDETVSTTQEVWQRGPVDSRTELLESDESEQYDVMVSNGATVWMYDEDANEVVRTDLGFDPAEMEALGEGMAETVYDGMNATLAGTETVADREAYVVELTPNGDEAMYESATLWIDRETHYPLKQESTTSFDGEMTITVEFEEITLDPDLDDELFTFEAPDDAEVVDANDFASEQFDDVDAAAEFAPFDLPHPEVPDGYALETVSVSENAVGWSATLQYTDETGAFLTVTVTDADREPVLESDGERVEIGDTTATVREMGGTGTTMLEWEADGLSYTVSGDLAEGDLIAIAESIVE